MSNIVRLLRRDFTRLFKAPAALIVVVVLLILPSVYTWFNVAGFWNPYENTGNIRVCVVNEDQGAWSEETGALDMGQQIVDELSGNTQLGWKFTDRQSALEEVRSGSAYAAIIIPQDFSSDMLTLLSSEFQPPSIQYYVNEKLGGVSTKVTDSGALTLDRTINDTFVSTISNLLAEWLDEYLDAQDAKASSFKSNVVAHLQDARSSLNDVKACVSDLESTSQDIGQKAQDAEESLEKAKQEAIQIQNELETSADLMESTQQALSPFMASLMSTLDESSVLASQSIVRANSAVGSVAGVVSGAEGTISSVVENGNSLISMGDSVLEGLKDLSEIMPEGADKDALDASIVSLEQQQESLRSAIDGVQSSYSSIQTASNDTAQASEELSRSLQGSLDASDEYRSSLVNKTFPALMAMTTSLADTTRDLSSALDSQLILIDKATAELEQMRQVLAQTSETLGATTELIESFEDDLDVLTTDISALSTAGALDELFGEDGIDPEKISDFMFSPAKIETISLYSVNSFGSAMAPLFMNLTLWIGVFMLLVILRQEVDREGIESLSVRQGYIGRCLFFAILASLQAVVCCTGNLLLGVEVANIGLFYVASVTISLTYLSIQYTLSTLFQHIGKGLCVVLIFVQIPGATGLYPIEMTPEFFQAVYPLFPFTYGINALRETIAGLYGMQLGGYLVILLMFLVVSFLFGLLLRPYFVNLNRMVAKQIKQSDIFNGEGSTLPARRYRSALLFKALLNQREFREDIVSKSDVYKKRYEKAKRYFVIIALSVPLVAVVGLTLASCEKVVILTVLLVWLVLVIMFAIIVEFFRDRLEHEVDLSTIADDDLRDLLRYTIGSKPGEARKADTDVPSSGVDSQ